MDFVSIVTPNFIHAQPALLALEAGFPVIIDKPLCFTMDEAKALRSKVMETGLPFGVTYTYAAYPMIKQMRAMILKGEIGKLRNFKFLNFPISIYHLGMVNIFSCRPSRNSNFPLL